MKTLIKSLFNRSLSVRLACLLLALIPIHAFAQNHFSSDRPLNPANCVPGLDAVTTSNLLNTTASMYNLTYNIYWNGDTPILTGVVTNGYTGNMTISAGIVASTTTQTLTYTLSIVPDASGKIALVISWERQTFSGKITEGTEVIGVVRKDMPGVLLAKDGQAAADGTVKTNSGVPMGKPTIGGLVAGNGASYGSGHWESGDYWTQTAYWGDDGVYHVVATCHHIIYWVEDPSLGIGSAMAR